MDVALLFRMNHMKLRRPILFTLENIPAPHFMAMPIMILLIQVNTRSEVKVNHQGGK